MVQANKLYQARYAKAQTFDALQVLRKACEDAQIPMQDASLRWLVYHSKLDGRFGDCLLFGVSKLPHMGSNMSAARAGPLPDAVLEACEAAWTLAKPAAEVYFRGYDPKPGCVDAFLQKVPVPDARYSPYQVEPAKL